MLSWHCWLNYCCRAATHDGALHAAVRVYNDRTTATSRTWTHILAQMWAPARCSLLVCKSAQPRPHAELAAWLGISCSAEVRVTLLHCLELLTSSFACWLKATEPIVRARTCASRIQPPTPATLTSLYHITEQPLSATLPDVGRCAASGQAYGISHHLETRQQHALHADLKIANTKQTAKATVHAHILLG